MAALRGLRRIALVPRALHLPQLAAPVPLARCVATDTIAPQVVSTWEGNPYTIRAVIKGGEHELVADEPEEDGGANKGPTPLAMFNAAVASCTAVTVALYATRRKLPVGSVQVSAWPNLPGEDGKPVKGPVIKSLHMEVDIHPIEGKEDELTPEMREKLMKIARGCAVRRSIEGGIQISEELV